MMYSDGGKKRQSPEQDQRQREQRRQSGPGAFGPSRSRNRPAAAAANASAEIGDEQPLEAVAVRRGQREHHRERHHGADDHGPEEPLLGVERRAPVAVRDGRRKTTAPGSQPTMSSSMRA